MQEKIKYSDIMALGFKESQEHDPVYERQYGFPYCIITLKLTKRIYLDWAKETQLCEMVRLKEARSGDIAAKLQVRDLAHLKEIVGFFKGTVEKAVEKPATKPRNANASCGDYDCFIKYA